MAKELNLSIRSIERENNLRLVESGVEIVDLLDDKEIKSFAQERKMRILVLEQLLDKEGVNLFI